MQITLGFVLIIVLIVIPGLLTRRLYFYGEFSKQFGSGLNIIQLLSYASIPGAVCLIIFFFFYNELISEIDLGAIIDDCKKLNSSNFSYRQSNDTPLNIILTNTIFPFLLFLYSVSTVLGLISGRLVKYLKLDIYFKPLRFKNLWFYLFTGQYTEFQKSNIKNDQSKKHLLTKADVLLDSEEGLKLYSGIVIDYELSHSDGYSLDKIMLIEAKRYNSDDGEIKSIPGDIFTIECQTMKNINLTYITESSSVESLNLFRPIIYSVFIILNIFIFILFVFKTPVFDFIWNLHQLNLFWRIIAATLFIQILNLLNPYKKETDSYKAIDIKEFAKKVIWVIILSIILLLK